LTAFFAVFFLAAFFAFFFAGICGEKIDYG
jgi:hypothetical protein